MTNQEFAELPSSELSEALKREWELDKPAPADTLLPRFMVTFGGYYVTRAKDESQARSEIPAPGDALPPCDCYITKVERLGY